MIIRQHPRILLPHAIQLEKWKAKYGGRELNIRNAELTAVKAYRTCAKCGTVDGKIHRHHIGNEYLLALFKPSYWAPIYIQFRDEDCIELCEDCHSDCHSIYAMVTYGVVDREWHDLSIKETRLLRDCFLECFDVFFEEPLPYPLPVGVNTDTGEIVNWNPRQ